MVNVGNYLDKLWTVVKIILKIVFTLALVKELIHFQKLIRTFLIACKLIYNWYSKYYLLVKKMRAMKKYLSQLKLLILITLFSGKIKK